MLRKLKFLLIFSFLACVCNGLGTDPTKGGICDSVTGQCPCLKNVEGQECSKCSPGYYNLASGNGCLECKCHKQGSLEGSCNQVREKYLVTYFQPFMPRNKKRAIWRLNRSGIRGLKKAESFLKFSLKISK